MSYNVPEVPTDGLKQEVPMDESKIDEVDHAVAEIDPAAEKRVLWKIDRVIMPLAILVYFCQYLDKRGLAFAAIFGLKKDLNLKGQDYSWASSIFYFGTLASQLISIKILHMFSIKIYVGVTVVLWGGVMMAQAAPQKAADLLAVRFLLGLMEGSAYPAFVLMISFWYRKAEHPSRFAMLAGADIFAQALGGLFLYGLSSIKGHIHGWRIAMLIAGGISICIGLAFAYLIPANMNGAWFLTAEEKQIAHDRVAREHASAHERHFQWDQFWETVKDPKFYLVFSWAFLLCACTVLNFGTLILNGLGYTSFITTVLQLPACAMQATCLILATLSCKRFPDHRGYIQAICAVVPLVGTTCNYHILSVNLSIISSNIKGHTRKTLFSTVYYLGYATGCIVGPQLFRDEQAPLYKTAMRAISSMYGVYIVFMLLFMVLCKMENSRRDRLAAEGNEEAVPRPAADYDNKTDKQDLSFRYVL
ncbi:hypothetical protein I204_00389 [Kwoniella mangroviensis CBS 8886]|nr:hypothetical protein I204_00389 [Kwoniella mangroviensis CBS 8886]